jgi:hypothetical protein
VPCLLGPGGGLAVHRLPSRAGPASGRDRDCAVVRDPRCGLIPVSPVLRLITHRTTRVAAAMRGNLVAQTAARAAAKGRFCVRSLPQPSGPANALDLPVTARTHRDGPGCRSTGRSGRSGQPRGPGFTSGPSGAAPRPRLRSVRRPALSGPPPGQVLLQCCGPPSIRRSRDVIRPEASAAAGARAGPGISGFRPRPMKQCPKPDIPGCSRFF